MKIDVDKLNKSMKNTFVEEYDDSLDFTIISDDGYYQYEDDIAKCNISIIGIMPIMLINRDCKKDGSNLFDISNKESILMVFGHEDDGKIWFDRKRGNFVNAIHIHWIDDVISNLMSIKNKVGNL